MEVEHKKRLITYNDKSFSCTTSIAMEFIGGKWKSVILIYLTSGKKRYNELYKLISTITERTLSLQLKQLENSSTLRFDLIEKSKLRLKKVIFDLI